MLTGRSRASIPVQGMFGRVRYAVSAAYYETVLLVWGSSEVA
jgi:hypothetical protein